jgi:HPt (histidine-containing phosphotransfer) domain-containing protein
MGGRRLAASCGRLVEKVAAGNLSADRDDLREVEAEYRELRRCLTAHLSSSERHEFPNASGTERTHHPALPVLDAEVVGRLERLGQESGEDLMGQLAVLFLAEAETQVAALHKALADEDAVAMARSAHALSGASANLGATELARLCGSLETDGAAGDLVHSGPLVEAVGAEVARVSLAFGSAA